MGPYRVRRVLAAGTLGPTLLVDASDDQPTLVVKLITTAVGDDAIALADALAPRAAAPVADPGIVPVTEVGIDPAGVFLVTPYIEASTLEARLRGGRQSLSQVLEWLAGPARGLVAAHQQQRLHGALHPRDILLPRGRGVLTGLDISPALEAVGLQAPVRVPFTAPERASGKPWDARADQYSLAMLALDALSGRRLIAGTIPAFDRWTLADTPGEDARLHDVFAKALNPDPAQRFGSVAEWLEALAGAAEPASELSRFTREGVIPAPAPDVRRTPPADEIEDAKALALFPEEEPSADVPSVTVTSRPSAIPSEDVSERPVSPTGEWLVASMPDDAPPLADTGPMPIQSVSPHDETTAAPIIPSHVDDHETDFALRPAAEFTDEGGVAVLSPHDESWRDAVNDDDDEPRRRGGWVVGLVLLLVAVLGFGTWRSLTRPEAPGEAGSNEVVGRASPEEGAAASDSASPSTSSRPPAPVADEPLRPSAEDVRPGAPPAVAPPAPAPVPPASVPPASTQTQTSPAPGAASPGASAPQPEAPLALDRARVLIRSSPAGQVRVNGQPRGQTPLVLRDLPFGSYVIVISRQGYVDAVREIDVLPSQPVASIAVDLERQSGGGRAPAAVPGGAPVPTAPAPSSPTAPAPAAAAGGAPEAAAGTAAAPTGTGSLYVVSRPTDARLFIDGQAYGTAPAVVPGLRGGAHVVRVQLPGYRVWEQRVEVQPGQRVRVDATLVPESR